MRSVSWRTSILAIVGILLLYWAGSSSFQYYRDYHNIRIKESDRARKETVKLVADIEKVLEPIPIAAKGLAKTFAEKSLTEESLEKQLESILLNNPDIFGVGVAFEPFALDPAKRLYAPYYMRKNHTVRRADVGDSYDYTLQKYKWYSEAINSKAKWVELYHGEVSEAWLIEYTVPVIKNNKVIGVVFVNYTLEALQKRINLIDLSEQGYSFMVDHNGRLVDYPVVDKIFRNTNIKSLDNFKTGAMENVVRNILDKQSGEAEYLSDITKKLSWLYYSPVSGTDLTVLTVFEQPSWLPSDLNLKRDLIYLLVSWNMLIIFFIVVVLVLLKDQGLNVYWFSAAIVSVMLLSSIATLWYVTLNMGYEQEDNVKNIVSHAELDRFEREYVEEALTNRNDPPLYVPTGVFVQSIEFTSANNVIMTGYIWQHYLKNYHKGLSREIVIPEAESVDIKPAYKKQVGDIELIGQYFRVALRQNFDYTHYPLDRQSVWLRLWHKDFEKNVVLVPDLNSYDQLNSHWLPGIEKDFVLSGWDLERSYFNYHYNSYNTNFGIENYSGQNNFPELYFNIGLKRDFFDPFVSQLTPMFVVLLMLFAILATSTQDERRNSLLGFNTAGVLASSSALFFVALVSHIDLRSSLAAKEIIYLENIYFIIYLGLLFVSINSILFSWGIRFPTINNVSFIQHRDNLIPKLLFWPMVTGQLFLLTVFDVYP